MNNFTDFNLEIMFQTIKVLFMTYAMQLLACLVLLYIGLKVINFLVKRTEKVLVKKDVDVSIVKFSMSLLKTVLRIGLVLALMSMLAIEVTSFVAILGAASFAVGMALQGSLSNFAAGVLILVLRPFSVGDFVEVAGTSGSVSGIQIFSTELKTPDNKTIIIPNSSIIGSNIVNYSLEENRRVDFVFGVDYDADIKKTKEVMLDVARSHDLVLKDPDVFIGVAELGDSSVNFALRVWVKSSDYWTVYFDINEGMKIRLDSENIGIPYPHIQIVKED